MFRIVLSMCSRSTRAQEDANEVERERIGATSESGASHLEDALPVAGAAARRLAISSVDARNTGRAAWWRLVMDIQMATSRYSTLLGVTVACPGCVAGLGAAFCGEGRWALAEAEAVAT
jgi:hypothetical protein